MQLVLSPGIPEKPRVQSSACQACQEGTSVSLGQQSSLGSLSLG